MPPRQGCQTGTVVGTAWSGRRIRSALGGFDMKLLKGLLLVRWRAWLWPPWRPPPAPLICRNTRRRRSNMSAFATPMAPDFLYPGTETCLRIGGLVLGEFRGFDPSYSIAGQSFYGNGIAPAHSGLTPAIASGLATSQRQPIYQRPLARCDELQRLRPRRARLPDAVTLWHRAGFPAG